MKGQASLLRGLNSEMKLLSVTMESRTDQIYYCKLAKFRPFLLLQLLHHYAAWCHGCGMHFHLEMPKREEELQRRRSSVAEAEQQDGAGDDGGGGGQDGGGSGASSSPSSSAVSPRASSSALAPSPSSSGMDQMRRMIRHAQKGSDSSDSDTDDPDAGW